MTNTYMTSQQLRTMARTFSNDDQITVPSVRDTFDPMPNDTTIADASQTLLDRFHAVNPQGFTDDQYDRVRSFCDGSAVAYWGRDD